MDFLHNYFTSFDHKTCWPLRHYMIQIDISLCEGSLFAEVFNLSLFPALKKMQQVLQTCTDISFVRQAT